MMNEVQDESVKWKIGAFTLIAFLLRAAELGRKCFWQDEVFSVLFARSPAQQFWSVLKGAEMNMALYYLLLRQWVQFAAGEAGVRFLSVIPGVLAVPAIYFLAKRLYSRRVGAWAAGLMAINTCAITYSQEARGYSFLILFVTLASWAFLRLVEKRSLGNAALYVLLSACAFYSHFYAVFVLLAHFCALLWLPKAPWKWVVPSWVAIAAAMVPGLRTILASHGANLWWLPKPGWLEIYRTLTFLAADNGKGLGAALTVLWLAAIVIALRTLWKLRRRSEESFRQWFAPLGLLVPMVATLGLSAWRPLFFHRFLIICLPAFLLLGAAGLAGLRNARFRMALACGILALSGVATALSYNKVREDWRGAAAYTIAQGPYDPVVFYIKDAAAPFAYYREGLGGPMFAHQPIVVNKRPSAADAAAWAAVYPRIWVVHFPSAPMNPELAAMTADMMTAYNFCGREELKGITVTRFSVGDCPEAP